MGDARSQKVSRSVDHDDNRRWALFLDFDGTLVDIAERPDAVCIDPILPAVLAQLRNGLDGALALVSGRPVATLDLLLAPFNSDAAGIHGGEWRYRGEYHRVCSEMDDGLRGVVHDLRAAARQLDDVIVEDKGASVAVHWRLAPHHEQAVRDVVATCFARLGSAFRCQSGKAVLEILPVFADKGRAVSRFLPLHPYRDRCPHLRGRRPHRRSRFRCCPGCGWLGDPYRAPKLRPHGLVSGYPEGVSPVADAMGQYRVDPSSLTLRGV